MYWNAFGSLSANLELPRLSGLFDLRSSLGDLDLFFARNIASGDLDLDFEAMARFFGGEVDFLQPTEQPLCLSADSPRSSSGEEPLICTSCDFSLLYKSSLNSMYSDSVFRSDWKSYLNGLPTDTSSPGSCSTG